MLKKITKQGYHQAWKTGMEKHASISHRHKIDLKIDEIIRELL